MIFNYTIATAIADSVGWDHMGGWAWSGMVLGWVLIAVFVAVVGWALVGDGRSKPVNRAIEILDERYARGEIDKTEYNERRGDLDR